MEDKNTNWDSALRKVATPLQARDEYAKREHFDKPHEYRGNYQRDRDRILYTATFRRLIGKTQVFYPGMGEDYRNRLTHTLEVSQIATTISKWLGLNIELTEAIALGHDIGHTPFGHVGERTLNNIMNNCDILEKYDIKLVEKQKGFKHNLQALRILCNTENYSRNYNGMNISFDTLWGIFNHTSPKWKECKELGTNEHCFMKRDRQQYKCPNLKADSAFLDLDFYNQYTGKIPTDSWSFEAYVVSIADEIARRHHDIEDSIISDILEPKIFINEFKKIFNGTPCFTSWVQDELKKIEKEAENEIGTEYLLPLLSRFIIHFYVTNYICDVAIKLKRHIIDQYTIKTSDDFYQNKTAMWEASEKEFIMQKEKIMQIEKIMSFNEDFNNSDEQIKKMLKNLIINSRKAQLMDGKGTFVIRRLFEAYLSTPNQLPDNVILKWSIDYGLFDKNEKITKYLIGELRSELENKRATKEEKVLTTLCRNICDYISSMTDRYALKQYEKLYGSSGLS